VASAPSKITLHRKSRTLEVVFDNNSFELRAEYLRCFSPSAEVKGHGPGQENLPLNKQDVAITDVSAQGNYAIKLGFSDGHDSGIYTWQYLKELGENEEQNWLAYQKKAAAKLKEIENQDIAPVKWLEP